MIYFDAAATTLEKPRQVREAVAAAVGSMSSPGRGSYAAARRAEETAFLCRSEAAKLFGITDPARVIFTGSATHGLNIAIRSLVKPGGRVVISGLEHNAVTRPLYVIPGLRTEIAAAPVFDPDAAVEGLTAALQEKADAVIWTHVSNVFGAVQPMERIADLCRRTATPLIVDASQSAGVLDLDVMKLQAAYVAMPGHKGLYGPQGTGLLLCGREDVIPLLQGGTGSASRLQEMPGQLPDRLEPGTHNMPGIAGLLAGLRFVHRMGPQRIRAHERVLLEEAVREMREIRGVRLYASDDPAAQTGVLSFTVTGWDCEELGQVLAQKGIAVRAGLHCAPLAHRTAGTLETGTVRLSFSAFNTREQVRRFADVLRRELREKVTL